MTHPLPGPVSRRDSGERVAVMGLGLTAYLAAPIAWAQGGLVAALDEVRPGVLTLKPPSQPLDERTGLSAAARRLHAA